MEPPSKQKAKNIPPRKTRIWQAPTPTPKILPRKREKKQNVTSTCNRKVKYLKHSPCPTTTVSATRRSQTHQHQSKEKKAKRFDIVHLTHRAYTYAMPCI
ncbi:hypothetical protein COCSADRAFT_33157 [Bipolaris sorokiniana ND90Pr]|uniref:Uncharacterized protein n=1 Tax=Cochliobolus sativus (strain ND90Pr / ATCC 201652) TaxID=665912 RepID=M2T0Z5_COCSN|nr:uncharacterized protein COCSADRAFT_33157 [Bipolaris sorokiniana ND90Pr]EMD68200.1 hypothetical protein COCSADRAFT_33157 [Bipolaris sorokiniana ND90Pr]